MQPRGVFDVLLSSSPLSLSLLRLSLRCNNLNPIKSGRVVEQIHRQLHLTFKSQSVHLVPLRHPQLHLLSAPLPRPLALASPALSRLLLSHPSSPSSRPTLPSMQRRSLRQLDLPVREESTTLQSRRAGFARMERTQRILRRAGSTLAIAR